MDKSSSMKSMNVQAQIRRNAEEQADFLRSMGAWETEIARKDEVLREKARKRAKERSKAAKVGVRLSGGTVKVATKEVSSVLLKEKLAGLAHHHDSCV